jgi:hypothetical protein
MGNTGFKLVSLSGVNCMKVIWVFSSLLMVSGLAKAETGEVNKNHTAPASASGSSSAVKSTAEQPDPDVKTKQDGDTYNFYFQKAPGANDVQQGREQAISQSGATDSPAKTDGTAEAVKSGQSMSTATVKEPKTGGGFELQAGLFLSPFSEGSGSLLGGQLAFTETLGMQLQMIAHRFEPHTTEDMTISADGIHNSKTTKSVWGSALGMTYSPKGWSHGKWPIRVQGSAGMMILKSKIETSTNDISASGIWDDSHASEDSVVLGYAGVEATTLVSKHYGFSGYGRITSDLDYSQLGVNFVWAF